MSHCVLADVAMAKISREHHDIEDAVQVISRVRVVRLPAQRVRKHRSTYACGPRLPGHPQHPVGGVKVVQHSPHQVIGADSQQPAETVMPTTLSNLANLQLPIQLLAARVGPALQKGAGSQAVETSSAHDPQPYADTQPPRRPAAWACTDTGPDILRPCWN